MSKIFYPSSEKLSFLLASIHNREVALPDFQRDFVWDPRETEELLESICRNYPAGGLLRIKNATGFYFAPREFAGAPPLDGHQPSYLILDGQQRLTSLYQALYGAGSHRYFVDLQGLIDGQDIEDGLFYLRQGEARRRYGALEEQAATFTFPLQVLFGEAGAFEEWLDQVLERRPEPDPDKKVLKQRLRDVHRKWLRTVEEYEFPMVTLSEDTPASAVCTIFETLNRTGVKLSVFDLLAARFWSGELRLRDLWDQARRDHPIISEFEVDPYYILQGLALLTARGAPSCKRTDILELDIDQVRRGWGPVVRGLADTLQIVRDDCGVVLPQWLPYYTILIPTAAVLASAASARGPEVGAIRGKLRRWFWCSVFGQAYEKAPNSQAAKDYAELTRWISGGAPPQTVADFSFDPASLRQVTPRQRGIYRGAIALVLRHGARDFHTAERITASMVLEKKIDDHHVFPQKYLEEKRPGISETIRDCVLNRTLIDRATNIRIGKRAPSDYLGEVRQHVGPEQLTTILGSHLLPATEGAPLLADDFDGFLDERQHLVAAQLAEVTQ